MPWAHHTLSILNTINLQTIVYSHERGLARALSSHCSLEYKWTRSYRVSDFPQFLLRPPKSGTRLRLTDLKLASDEHLIFRLQVGDKRQLASSSDVMQVHIYRIGRKMLRDPVEADDLVQEVFLYVYRKAELYDTSKGPARSWIFQIAYTQAFLQRRKLKSLGFYAPGIADDFRGS